MNTGHFCCGFLLPLSLLWNVSGQDPPAAPSNDPLFEKLKDADMDVRINALRQLQTTLDPRLPDALLPLLSDEGHSIRRLAARGVGSRYHQIPADRVPVYLKALKPLTENRDGHYLHAIARMAERAIGLLTRKYEGEVFSPSPDGKWVIYERYSLPCLIDLERKNEELLGWHPDKLARGWFAPVWGTGEVAPYALWHPESKALALEIIMGRKDSALWVWRVSGSRLIELDPDDIARTAGVDPERVFGPAGFYATPRRWKGDEFQFEVSFSVQDPAVKSGFKNFRPSIGWNLETEKMRLIPKSKLPSESNRP